MLLIEKVGELSDHVFLDETVALKVSNNRALISDAALLNAVGRVEEEWRLDVKYRIVGRLG